MFPIPEEAITAAASECSRVIVAEENLNGQYRAMLAEILKLKEVIGVNSMGSMITPEDILERIMQ
jgi:pyruvate/2-oxoacid:ferredoxin oxidoreductase alpha subunit